MTRRDSSDSGLPQRLALIVTAVTLMVAAVLALDKALTRPTRPAVHEAPSPVLAAAVPIPAEAGVFRALPDAFDDATSRRAAHPRTIATFRALRAYPGAPPRIPHGLTTDEFRTGTCRTCHERGGYAPRFDAYAPVTPHPELTDCLQCHTADAALVRTAPPAAGPDGVCRQCHDPGLRRTEPALDFRAAAWPPLSRKSERPPPIPHDLDGRGNCLACHSGAGAVAELRTTHPERADCRQCHLHATHDPGPFMRPAPAATGAGGER